jgi:post-segregation antitoxin (ccd killing protein)
MATNLSLDPDLLERALKVSGEKTKKAAVTKALEEFIARRWVEENREAIAAYNEDVKTRDVWPDGMQSW